MWATSLVSMKRLAVVTGASRGWGRALVDEFAASGWKVSAVSRSQDGALGRKSSGDVEAVEHDVRSEDFNALFTVIGQHPVDLLINNAAQGAGHQQLGSISPEGVTAAVDVNVGGPCAWCRHSFRTCWRLRTHSSLT